MTHVFGYLIIFLLIAVIPALTITFFIRLLMRKKVRKLLMIDLICIGMIIPLTICGVLTDPKTWCEHEFTVIEEHPASCDKEGKVVSVCGKCERERTESEDKIPHDMQPVENGQKCAVCGYEEITKEAVKEEKPVVKEKPSTEKVEESKKDEPVEKTVKEEKQPKEKANDWKSVFAEKGFTDEEISSYEEILTNVGITDYHDVEVGENGRMHIVRGKIFDSKNLQVNVTLEDRKIILVELAGIPSTKKEAYINWRGKLKFKTVGTTESVDLYYDVSGGYVAKYDEQKNLISPYDE